MAANHLTSVIIPLFQNYRQYLLQLIPSLIMSIGPEVLAKEKSSTPALQKKTLQRPHVGF